MAVAIKNKLLADGLEIADDQSGLPEGWVRILGYRRHVGPPVPGVGPILSIRAWRDSVIATRSPDGVSPGVAYVGHNGAWWRLTFVERLSAVCAGFQARWKRGKK